MSLVRAVANQLASKSLRAANSRFALAPAPGDLPETSSPFRKNISLRELVETPLVIPPSRLGQRGVGHRHQTLGAGCSGRGGGARRATPRRTAKSCGSGTPTLVPSSRGRNPFGSDGGNQARSPGRARRKPLKPLRREGRAFPANLWWTYSCAFLFRTRGCGCAVAPGFPCALSLRGVRAKLGRDRVARARSAAPDALTIEGERARPV